ncbi:predicted protein [Chaetomium globosum CBS 148.51]|uniref:Uncharacterized protein n=1 Tax=Chaetomium globosum (strain ATCC 6205 / CBS 148.51 / DSM 1962 / NBRC 6347 / NRRL 1970) TaxID=306901 RepID=Q2HBM4_CHAGB|nr:uncharacterized protein CHGG_02380 [Chaetomium globosum CBS 148.51]EAQ90445.1 predicted protein [Chaetomium globosum CBS 148.51]
MWADLQAIHSPGILVGDTHGGNYLGGKLVGFSRAWTMYHPALIQTCGNKWQELMLEELQKLQDNYYDLRNSLAPETLDIPQGLEAFCSRHIAYYRNLPSAYNWAQVGNGRRLGTRVRCGT